MAQSVLEVLDQSAIARLSEGEPAWLREVRHRALDLYESLPAPTDRALGWRRLEFDPKNLVLPVPARNGARSANPPPSVRGVVVSTLTQALQTHEEMVREALSHSQRPLSLAKYAALTDAAWLEGAFVYIPAGCTPAEPIEIALSGAPYQRVVIVADVDSHASVVERHNEQQPLAIAFTDIVVRDNAQLRYAHVQEAASTTTYFSLQRARVGRDAKLITLNFAMGGVLAKSDVEVELSATGAESDMLGLVFGEGHQQFDFHTLQGHRSPNTRSDLLFKSAMDDSSHSLYTGVITIEKGAQRSDAYQANRNLMLSEGARADTEPMLEIEADDVRCTHGATVGPIDEETLFYAATRGLSPDDAARLIVEGFFAEVFQKFGDERVTTKLAEKVSPHLGRVGAH